VCDERAATGRRRRGRRALHQQLRHAARPRQRVGSGERVRGAVEPTDEQSAYLRGLSRPSRTNGPRTLGTKFVATGVLIAAIHLLREVDVDMHGVAAGDEDEMVARAREALLRAGQRGQEGGAR
jgi:hypothetical protein